MGSPKWGWAWTEGGRYFHLIGRHDKGTAAARLTALYRKPGGRVETIGLGDGLNDRPMLAAVDVPIPVRRPDGTFAKGIRLPRLRRADGIGPKGWNRAVLALLGGKAVGQARLSRARPS